jgi:hypothetical protein
MATTFRQFRSWIHQIEPPLAPNISTVDKRYDISRDPVYAQLKHPICEASTI